MSAWSIIRLTLSCLLTSAEICGIIFFVRLCHKNCTNCLTIGRPALIFGLAAVAIFPWEYFLTLKPSISFHQYSCLTFSTLFTSFICFSLYLEQKTKCLWTKSRFFDEKISPETQKVFIYHILLHNDDCRWTKISVQQYENTVKCYSRSQIILPSRPGAKREPGCVLLVQFGREEEDNKSCLPSSPRIPPFVKLAKCKYVILVDIRLRPAKSWGAWKPHKNVMIAQ